jgi:hypothetical protein
MPANDALFFIDANKYLDLYRTDKGKKLLASLEEQVDYIFVTEQIVNEVQRNKILVAGAFLKHKFKGLKLQSFNVPDHLSGTNTEQGKEIHKQMSEISQKIRKVNADVDELALGILEQISCSQDEVSQALSPIFDKAISHSSEELQNARDRRELGNPPGKSNNPIGDQLTWEQILTNFEGKKRLWIISRDGDYGTVYGGKGFLNRFLHDELCKVASEPEAYLFENLVEGIAHFVDTTGVTAEKRLSPEEADEVEREERSLPHYRSESLKKVIGDVDRFRSPLDSMRSVLGDVDRLHSPLDSMRSVLGNIDQLSSPLDGIGKGMGDMNLLSSPLDGIGKVMGDMNLLSSPLDGIGKVMGDMNLLSSPLDGIGKVMGDMNLLSSPLDGIGKGMGDMNLLGSPLEKSLEGNQKEEERHLPPSTPQKDDEEE